MVNDLVVSALSFVLPCNVLQKVLLKAYAFICIYWPEQGRGPSENDLVSDRFYLPSIDMGMGLSLLFTNTSDTLQAYRSGYGQIHTILPDLDR